MDRRLYWHIIIMPFPFLEVLCGNCVHNELQFCLQLLVMHTCVCIVMDVVLCMSQEINSGHANKKGRRKKKKKKAKPVKEDLAPPPTDEVSLSFLSALYAL